MKKKNILIVFLAITIILVISLIIFKNFVYRENADDSNIDNKIQDISISDILLSNIVYDYDNENTNFSLIATNNSENSARINTYVVSIYDENDNLIDIFGFNNSITFESGNGYYMGFAIDMKYKDTYKLKIEFPELEVIK